VSGGALGWIGGRPQANRRLDPDAYADTMRTVMCPGCGETVDARDGRTFTASMGDPTGRTTLYVETAALRRCHGGLPLRD
jgi:hypothetical protein